MASQRKGTDALPVIRGQDLPNVGAKVCGNTERESWERRVGPLLVMVLNLKLKGFWLVCLTELKRVGVEWKDLDSNSGSVTYWLCVLGQAKFWDMSHKYVCTIQLDVGSSVANKDKLL